MRRSISIITATGLIGFSGLSALVPGVAAQTAPAQAAPAQTAPAQTAPAQTAPPVRVRGTVEALSADAMTVRTREGRTLEVKLAPEVPVMMVVPLDLSAIKSGSFIGTAAMPQPDGTLTALEVLVFPESARGSGEGHYPWDLAPDSTMTNATVADMVGGADGRMLTLTYKDGTKKVRVPDGIPVVSFAPGERALLKPGAHVFFAAVRRDDGSTGTTRVLVGKDGLVPPM